MKTDRRRLWY